MTKWGNNIWAFYLILPNNMYGVPELVGGHLKIASGQQVCGSPCMEPTILAGPFWDHARVALAVLNPTTLQLGHS